MQCAALSTMLFPSFYLGGKLDLYDGSAYGANRWIINGINPLLETDGLVQIILQIHINVPFAVSCIFGDEIQILV